MTSLKHRTVTALVLSGAIVGATLAWLGAPSAGANVGTDPQVAPSVATDSRLTEEPSAPDGLTLVLTTTGIQAYVQNDELDAASGGNVANPQEAKQWMDHVAELRAQGITQILIPAYLDDGVTVVGEFAISLGSGDPVEGIPVEELCEVFADDPLVLEELLAGRICIDGD